MAVEVGEAMETKTEEAVAVQGGVVAVGVVAVEEEEGKVEVEVACQHRPQDQGNAGHSSSDKEIPEHMTSKYNFEEEEEEESESEEEAKREGEAATGGTNSERGGDADAALSGEWG